VGGLGVALLAALAPPALALGIGLTLLLAMLAVRLDLARAFAIPWALAVLPVYLDIPEYSLPADLVIIPILLARVFIGRRRWPSVPGPLDAILGLVALGAMGISTARSADVSVTGFHLLRCVFWLSYIPAARVVYHDRRALTPAFTALLIATTCQALLGLVQLALGNDFTVGVLELPFMGAFFPSGALEGRLATKDFNWITFGRAFPSGLFLNAIVYGVCLATAGMALLTVPNRWLPSGRAWPWRAGGALALFVAFLTLKLTAWIGLVAGAITAVVLRIRDPRVRWRVLLIPPIVVLILGFLFEDLIEQRLQDIASGSLITRLFVWYTYMTNLRYGGLLGVGLGQANVLAPELPTIAAGQQLSMQFPPESSFVGLAVEIGVPGTIALFAFLVLLGLERRPLRASWALPAIITALAGNLSVYGLTDEHILPLVALLAGAAAAPGTAGEPL
jgi:hypothetical protein